MEWRHPFPESERSEAVLTLSRWPGLSWGWREAGGGRRERGAQTKTKGCLALAQQFADSEEQSVSQVRRQRRSLCVLVGVHSRVRAVLWRKHGFQAWNSGDSGCGQHVSLRQG